MYQQQSINLSITELMMNTIEYLQGVSGANIPLATADAAGDWKHINALNHIRLSYEPVTPNERVGLSPVSVKRLMAEEQDKYYRNNRVQSSRPKVVAESVKVNPWTEEETHFKWYDNGDTSSKSKSGVSYHHRLQQADT